MEEFLTLEISDSSSTPKYKQIVNSIIEKIEAGKITYGQKLPSINQLSFDYILARDTVEKAYNELKSRGIIESVKGKGYYVKNTSPESKLKVLVLFNKLSSYKKVIYNVLAHQLGEKAQIDFFIYHCNYELFEKIISERLGDYNYYVLMPHFISFEVKQLEKLLQKIPREKVILLDHQIEGIDHYQGLVYQDFKMDIYDALSEAVDLVKKYKQLTLVFPENQNYPYPKEIILGFRRFCAFHSMDFDIISEFTADTSVKPGTAYVIIEESDLVNLIKKSRQSGIKLGDDVGVISYNDTPLKEVLEDGISVITTDFEKMGKIAAKMMMRNEFVKVKNDFKLIIRHSL